MIRCGSLSGVESGDRESGRRARRPRLAGGVLARGYGRLRRLRDELRGLRSQVGLPLPDLVNEVERALGLDIEVAARSGLDPSPPAPTSTPSSTPPPRSRAMPRTRRSARSSPTSRPPRPRSSGWRPGAWGDQQRQAPHRPRVQGPGVARGRRPRPVVRPAEERRPRQGSIFPSPPQNATRWTANPRVLPFMLRGDRADLPALTGLEKDDLAAFDQACAERDLREERRLAYVAVTRASALLITTGYWWGSSGRPLGPSPFLEEVRAVCVPRRVRPGMDRPAGGGRREPAARRPRGGAVAHRTRRTRTIRPDRP